MWSHPHTHTFTYWFHWPWGLLNEPTDDEYVDDSGDDLEEMREDEELAEIMDFVFGPESDEEDIA